MPIFEALHEHANLEELHMVQMFPRLEPSRLYTSVSCYRQNFCRTFIYFDPVIAFEAF